jgi:hypothetical protein
MSVFHENMLIGASGQVAAGGISRSIRLNAPDSAYLSRTPASAGNRKTWTWAGWVKRSNLTDQQSFWSAGSTGTNRTSVLFDGSARIRFFNYAGSVNVDLVTTPVYRDASASYHFVIAVDTTQGTASNRIKLYVNGVEVTAFSTSTYPSSSQDLVFNSAIAHGIGRGEQAGGEYFSGYLADIYFIDGQALTPSSFTETDATTGQLIPKAYTGSYGSQGWHLEFADNSSNTATTLGKDTSGNGNNWTPNNLSVTAGAGNDSLVDVPTNGAQTDTGVGGEVRGNYCTLNPLNTYSSITLSNGNLDYSHGSSGGLTVGTIGVSTGKWYWEHVASTSYTLIGLYQSGSLSMGFVGASGVSLGFTSGGFVATSGGPTYVNSVSYGTSDVIGFALNMDAGTLTIYKNGSATSLVFSGLTGTWFPAEGANSTSSGVFNFGARSFAYTAPSGFKALNTANLPTPAVVKSNTAMDVKLYTGNGSTQTISGLLFSPDLVWIKGRSVAYDNVLEDTVRGVNNSLRTNGTNGEITYTGSVTAFNSDGFSLGSQLAWNENNSIFVAWTWDAGSSTVTNTAGSITSSVRANATAGFSVVTFTSPSSGNFTVGHGLGVAPSLIIAKDRTNSGNWHVYHASVTTATDKYLLLNTTNSLSTYSSVWGSALPTSTVFGMGVGASIAASANTVAYCFAPVAGYSSFGSYTGNGSTDGPFVYTGMRPRYLLVKRTDATSSWEVYDAARNPSNLVTQLLEANTAGSEFTGTTNYVVDFLSNGFKPRGTFTDLNASGGTYIYVAFAESPFNYSRAR